MSDLEVFRLLSHEGLRASQGAHGALNNSAQSSTFPPPPSPLVALPRPPSPPRFSVTHVNALWDFSRVAPRPMIFTARAAERGERGRKGRFIRHTMPLIVCPYHRMCKFTFNVNPIETVVDENLCGLLCCRCYYVFLPFPNCLAIRSPKPSTSLDTRTQSDTVDPRHKTLNTKP